MRIPLIILIKGKGFINHGSGLRDIIPKIENQMDEMEIRVNTGISILSGPREQQGLALRGITAGIRQRTPKSQQKTAGATTSCIMTVFMILLPSSCPPRA